MRRTVRTGVRDTQSIVNDPIAGRLDDTVSNSAIPTPLHCADDVKRSHQARWDETEKHA